MAPETVNTVKSMAGLFEGSAEMSSDLYSLASVIYNSHPHNFPARNRAEDQHSTVGRYIFMPCEVYFNRQLAVLASTEVNLSFEFSQIIDGSWARVRFFSLTVG